MKKEMDLTNGIYIPSIEAKWLYKADIENEDNNYEIKEEYLDKLLNGKLDYSFEFVENKELIDNIEIMEMVDGKLYTFDIVNVKYNEKYRCDQIEKTTKQLRDWTYINGFKFSGKQMRNWKRSGGKARIGQNLFLAEKHIESALAWGRMGLEFKDDVSIASVRAYESLSLSSIIGCIKINPKNILVIADYPSEFNWNMSKTWLEDGNLKTETMEVKEKNSIWDGEGLLNSKIFDSNEIIKGYGVALLRNRLTKCAGFYCNMELFYKTFCEENGYDYDTYEVEDMYGNLIKVKDIELITTPSAIKIEKFNDEILKNEDYEGEGAWLQYWKDNCGETFGVCKTEKPSHYDNGRMNVLSYQMLNTIPLTKEQLAALVEPEIEYINKLKTDLKFFLQEVNQLQENGKSEDTNKDENELKIGSNIDVTGAFIQLANRNPDFQKTQVFKDFRRNFVDAYVSELRQGKIRIESDYCVACGNGMELLKATVGQFNGTSELVGENLYCSRFDDGDKVIGFRNPHVNMANCGTHTNKKIKDLETYFNCTPNIVFLNSIGYPTLSLYQGEDFDIDANLLTKNKIIVDACTRINEKATPIPVKDIKDSGTNKAKLTGQNMSDIDHKIAENYIGSVINLSQEINSLISHLEYNGLLTEEKFDELYKRTSRLSSISQVEIDKAKKQFNDLNVPKELEKMKIGLKLVDDEDANRICSDIDALKDELKTIKADINEFRKSKRKPIKKEIRRLKKESKKDETINNDDAIQELEKQIEMINSERQIEIVEQKVLVIEKYKELSSYDTRRLKPYFFKFIGDNEAKKQRASTNKKYRRKLDQPIIQKYCDDNSIDIKDVDMSNKDLIKLFKINDSIFQDWKERVYVKMDTPMDWLQDKIDKGLSESNKNEKGKRIKTETIQVIELVKKNTNKIKKDLVDYIIKVIVNLDKKIKSYKLNDDLSAKDKLEKIRYEKYRVSNSLRDLKMTKADIYGVLRKSLNSVKNNGKINKKSGIESISLEILFKVYGTGLLNMFK